MSHQLIANTAFAGVDGNPGAAYARQPDRRDPLDALEHSKALPPAPWVIVQLLNTLSAPAEEVEADQIVRLIRRDEALSVELLRRVNSARYGREIKISSLARATITLGFSGIRSLALTVGLRSFLGKTKWPPIMLRTWRHGLACGFIAEELAHACEIQPDTAYTAGFMHDLGRLMMLINAPRMFENLNPDEDANRNRLLETERRIFDIDHAEAGGLLAAKWGFPSELILAIAEHHHCSISPTLDLPKLIQTSCRLADSFGYATVDFPNPDTPEQILAVFPDDVFDLVTGVMDELRESIDEKVKASE